MKMRWPQWAMLSACCVLFFVCMFEHMTALKNLALAVLALALVADTLSRPRHGNWPLAAPFALWGGFALLSLAWSIAPAMSLHAWLDEIVYPTLGFYGVYRLAACPGEGGSVARPSPGRAASDRGRALEMAAWLGVLGVALLSLIGYGQLQPQFIHTGVLRFYARVGHSSTLALLGVPLWLALSTRRDHWRWLGASGLLLALWIGFASLNRFFWIALLPTAFIACLPVLRRHPRSAACAVPLLVLLGFCVLVVSGHLRSAPPAPEPSFAHQGSLGHALVALPNSLENIAERDTRRALWTFYGEQARRHPWLGVGFGKPLPGRAYADTVPAALLRLEPQSRTHAHNIFLNTLLQTGVVGLLLQCALFFMLARAYRLRWRRDPWLASAGIALVIGMLCKNMTDDFMWQSTMLMFWMQAGLLLGRLERAHSVRVVPA